jgi:hypothetical protein
VPRTAAGAAASRIQTETDRPGLLLTELRVFAKVQPEGNRNGTASTPVATLTIKNIPQAVVDRLKQQAALHRRSLNLQVIVCLEAAVQAVPVDPEALLARIRAVRVRPRGRRLTDRLLTRLKTAGRP